MSIYTEQVKKPKPEDVNGGLSPCHQSTMIRIFGAPRTVLSVDCKPPNNPKVIREIVTANVGPFRVTGNRKAIASLTIILARVKADHPDLYAMLGTAGMLCCRAVRGSKTSWSNHSWGTAIDLNIAGLLDAPGDNLTMHGLLVLYGYFHAEGWYWGTEFPKEDSMHFELADETIRRLYPV